MGSPGGEPGFGSRDATRPPRMDGLVRMPLSLLYAPLTIPLVSGHSKSFQRASRVVKPSQGGAKRTAVWAAHHEERCSDGVIAPHVCDPMGVPHRWVGGA